MLCYIRYSLLLVWQSPWEDSVDTENTDVYCDLLWQPLVLPHLAHQCNQTKGWEPECYILRLIWSTGTWAGGVPDQSSCMNREIPRAAVQKPTHFLWRAGTAAQAYTQECSFLTAKSVCSRREKFGNTSCRSSPICSCLRPAVAKAGGGCPPLATRVPFSSSLGGWGEITLNTEAGSWRQLLVIDSTKYETACTSSMKHGISSILLVGEMNGAWDNLGKLGIC